MIKRFIWFFKNCVLRGTKVSYSNDFKMKGSVYWDGFITHSNNQFFQDPKSNIWTTFLFSFFFCSDFMIMKFIPFFLEVSAKIPIDKSVQNKVHLFHANADIKAVFTFLKKHIHKWKKIHDQKTKKTASSWSFILMLLMTTDKFSKFDRICVDQGLNLVFEGCAILHGMSSNSSMVFTYGIDIVSFGYGGLLGLAGMTEIP